MKKAVIYARYSSEKQTEQSIEGQLHVCKDYAIRNNITIVDTYVDRATTGTNDKRENFQQMLKDSYKKEWDYVLVYKIDRFGRNKYEIAINKHTLRNNGIKLLSAMENIPDTPEGIILESLLEGMAEYYSAELAQKVKRGMKELRMKGHFQGGNLSFGYKCEDKKIVIHEENAKLVKWIFEQFIQGTRVLDIINELDNRGIKRINGKSFDYNSLWRLLTNEKYTGIYRHGDEVYENMYPAIINKELFDLAQQKLKDNKYVSNGKEDKYLLSHKLICGNCGMTLFGCYGKSSKNKKSI